MFTSKTILISFFVVGSSVLFAAPCFAQIQFVQPTSAVSRLKHDTAGTFDINLPLSGAPGIECRAGSPSGAYQVVLTFPHAVTFTSAAVSGTASLGTTSTSGNQVTVNVTGVADAQTIIITLFGVTDGVNGSDVSVPMAVLIGDTTGNGIVNSSDIAQTQSQSGQPVTATNFRNDVTVNGIINSSDIALVQSESGTAVPATSFSFTLDGSYKTSAAVYNASGGLVKTLWRNVLYGPGQNTGYWYGYDDNGAPVSTGSYLIKLLYHNVQYVWDGAIGNTSATSSGTTVHRGSTFMQSLAIDPNTNGTAAFYAIGECEGFVPVSKFATTSPQSRATVVQPDFLTGFDHVATDGIRVYIASRGSAFSAAQPTPPPSAANNAFTTFVMARNVADGSPSPFPSPYGTPVTINNNGPSHYDGVIDLNLYSPSPTPTPDAGVNPNLPTSLAVQKSGSALAVAHGAPGGPSIIRLFDKTSGAPLSHNIAVSNPQELAMAPNGDLWVITGTSLQRYSTLTTTPSLAQTITGLTAPVAVAVHPSNDDLILVADGGTAQIVRAFNRSATSVSQQLWTYGVAGGWSTNGPDATDNKFGFQVGDRVNPISRTALAVQSDGSFWIGDGATNRLLHIKATHDVSLPGDTIMFLAHNGATTADPNNPTRVIGDNWLEFQVDYTKPIQQGWTLKKNWAAGLNSKYFGTGEGLLSVTTLNANSVNRVYATMVDFSLNKRVIVELPSTGPLRVCKTATNNDLTIDPVPAAIGVGQDGLLRTPSFESDGSLRYNQFSAGPVVSWYQRTASFDSLGNPTWGNAAVIASTTFDNKDPATIGEQGLGSQGQTVPITSSNVIVSFDSGHHKWPIPACGPGCTISADGWHLGGIARGANQWQWKDSHAVSKDVPFDGLGSFDIGDGVQSPATVAMALGQNIVYDYNGELWNQTEASQWMHFYDDGLFVGQFGTPGTFEHASDEALAGFSGGGGHFPALVGVDKNNNPSATGEAFIWANDESQHSGIIRWHLIGANTIREQTGTVALGGNVTLSGPNATFPTGLTATPGNQQVTLSWTSFPGATSYDVKKTTVSGGPYSVVTTTASTNYPVPSLTNGTPYYFVVSATGGTVNSTEIEAWPFNTVGTAGSFRGGPPFNHYTPLYPFYVDSSAPASGKPALIGLSNALGTLTKTNIGTKGYVIYDGTTVYNTTQSPFTVTQGSGWANATQFVQNQFVISGNATADGSLKANSSGGTITVNAGGASGIHYLTVVCPSFSADPRTFALTLTQGTPTATYQVNEPQGSVDNLIYQFEFTGNVTLTLTPTGGSGCLQAIFID